MSLGFDKFTVSTKNINGLLQQEIKHLLQSPHSNNGLDRSLLIQLQANKDGYRENSQGT